MNTFDGAWRAVYASELFGDGLVILRNGRAVGCDHRYFFEGTYSMDNDGTLSVHVDVQHYAW